MSAVTTGAPGTKPHLDEGTLLSVQRTQLAAERTLMAWIRTAFSMISFGFTMGKFLEYLHDKPGREQMTGGGLLPRALVLLGLASLVIGLWEFRHTMRALSVKLDKPLGHFPVGFIAALVALIGVAAFLGLMIRIPFL